MNEEVNISQGNNSENILSFSINYNPPDLVHGLKIQPGVQVQSKNTDFQRSVESEEDDPKNHEQFEVVSTAHFQNQRKPSEILPQETLFNNHNKVFQTAESFKKQYPVQDTNDGMVTANFEFKNTVNLDYDLAEAQQPAGEKLEISDIAIEMEPPRMLSYQSSQNKVSLAKLEQQNRKTFSVLDQQQSNQKDNKDPFQRYQTPEPKKAAQLAKVSKMNFTDGKNLNDDDTYHDEDSQIMSEHQGTQEAKKFQFVDKVMPKPVIYQVETINTNHDRFSLGGGQQLTTQRLSIRDLSPTEKNPIISVLFQEQLKVRNKAILPTKKIIDFANIKGINSSPNDLDDEEDEFQSHQRRVVKDLKVKELRHKLHDSSQLKSSLSWKSDEIHLGLEGLDAKSQPFSQVHKGDLENPNILIDHETMKFSVFEQTPKMTQTNNYYSTLKFSKAQLRNSQYNSHYKSSLGNEDDLENQLQRLQTITQHVNITNHTPLTNHEKSKFYNTQQSMLLLHGKQLKLALQEAQQKGSEVRRQLEFFNLRSDKSQEFVLPEGLIVFNEFMPVLVDKTDILILNGINGSKIAIDESNTLIIKNHQSDRLIFRAIQFELTNSQVEKDKHETPMGERTIYGSENILIQVLQEDTIKEQDNSQQVPKKKTFIFEDCAFLQDISLYEIYDNLFPHGQCSKAINVVNNSNNIEYELIFQNCIFIGFHHAIEINSKNVSLDFQECIFKKQQYESIFLTNLSSLKISKSVFKKSCLQDAHKACIAVFSNGQKSDKEQIVAIDNSLIKKCKGVGLLIKGNNNPQKLQIKIKETKFIRNEGDSAVRFENLREFSQKENSHSSLKSPFKERQKALQIVRLQDCDIANNKRNGIEFWNMTAFSNLTKCNIYENKFSGLFINQNPAQEPSYNMCNCQEYIYDVNNNNRQNNQIDKGNSMHSCTNTIKKCNILMNQTHGIEMLNFKRQHFLYENCTIEDNFCDGINIASEELLEDMFNIQTDENFLSFQSNNEGIRQLKPRNPEYKIRLNSNKIQSNKNTGLNVSQLHKHATVNLLRNDFTNNLISDVQINDLNSYKRTHFLTMNGKDTNNLEQEINRNFDYDLQNLNLQGNLRSMTEHNEDSFSQTDVFRTKRTSDSLKKSITTSKTPSAKKKNPASCLGWICVPKQQQSKSQLSNGKNSTFQSSKRNSLQSKNSLSSKHLLAEEEATPKKNKLKRQRSNTEFNPCSIF